MTGSRRTLFCSACIFLLAAGAHAADFKEGTSGPASLRLVEGVPVVHVYGTPAEMGAQQGKLLAPQIQFLMKEYLSKFLALGGTGPGLRPSVLKLAREMEKSIPAEYVQEMQALAEAAGVQYDDVLLANTVFDIKRAVYCSTVVAVGGRSADGQPIFGRNLDFPTMGVAQHYTCVIVYHPKHGHAVASVIFPGLVGVLSGMNDAGVSAAVMEVHVRGSQINATPYAMVFRTALAGAGSTDDVVKAVSAAARSCTNNLMICDAAGNAACAELALRAVAVRKPEDGALFATNHFLSKELGRPALCWRIPLIEKALKDGKKVGQALVQRILADVAFNELTMQSIVFRPASREFLLAAGDPPAAKRPFVRLKKAVLFPEKQRQ